MSVHAEHCRDAVPGVDVPFSQKALAAQNTCPRNAFQGGGLLFTLFHKLSVPALRQQPVSAKQP